MFYSPVTGSLGTKQPQMAQFERGGRRGVALVWFFVEVLSTSFIFAHFLKLHSQFWTNTKF